MEDSVFDKNLIIVIDPAQATEEHITKIEPILTSEKPGLITTQAPKKPITRAIHLFNSDFSPNKRIAKKTVNKGAVNDKATFCANGEIVNAEKKKNIPHVCNKLLRRCQFNLSVFKMITPDFKSRGRTTIKPKKFLKKAICIGWISSDTNRTKTCIKVNIIVAKSI